MDAQYPFASRDDIWRVFEELKELHATQYDQAERIARLERRRDEDARLRSVWGPLSPFPSSVAGTVLPTEAVFHSPADAFKGFDQGQHHSGVANMGLENEDEPRRGTSRANSVRFDESAIHGYYGQTNRSSSELPLRTGSGMGCLPLTERSWSHRSDGRQSSSGHSHHSVRTNSLGLETTSRMMSSIMSDSPLVPPPGLFLLGPVPAIIRCWLTTNFSNDSLLYAAVCSGSYTSLLGYPMIQKLGLEDHLVRDGDFQFIKLPMYLPEASVHQASSRSNSPMPQVPTLTIRFLVRPVDPNDNSIQIILGSDILRSHNADILFSQDKIIMVDDEKNKISIPLVRPEDDSVFKNLQTGSRAARSDFTGQVPESKDERANINGHSAVGVISKPTNVPLPSTSAPSSVRNSIEGPEDLQVARFSDTQELPKESDGSQAHVKPAVASDTQPGGVSKAEPAGVWGSWKRDAKFDPNAPGAGKPSRGRTMKVLRPSKPSTTRTPPVTTGSGSSSVENIGPSFSQPTSAVTSPDGSRTGKQLAPNPIGGASAFPWLNSS
ncbi:hypothetical protein P175DRAFT_0534280 [Aspergillus ochraceoroseus IBT 24754]|uniref:Ubiquitin carboxyl-terminal hydrolase 19 n=3 Tax=Aspergillus subgen. Nidulantes TaxID=2720870 RepID=A0A0F8UT35_9EURO|nr:uncharacterized protein P175DRAFT_0534280 [Aspergillus ochraceoroseus IBT 24754]KKK14001.1 hypothetical protein ARAM_006905 [Aspergillus rambellii]PTU18543.1 hypothetical protein P175DRAFT_0534280 [Aspergillus ochraceoroseus IBT 24754]